MKHNKFKTNKLTAAASQDQSQTPQQDNVFSNLSVSGIQGQMEMKHTKFQTNKLTTAAWTKAENDKTSKKGFTWGGSDGVNHVAREVLQHGVANRGSLDGTIIIYWGVCNEGISWSISVGNKFPTEIVLISTEMFAEIGFSTEMGLSWGSGNFGKNVPHVHRGI